MASKEEQEQKAIVCGRNENPDLSVRKLAKKLGFPASTVHSVLKSFDTRFTTAKKAGSGTKTDLRNHQKDAKVKQILQKRPDLSVRTVARKIKMSPTFVHTSKHRQGMKSFKVKTVPNRCINRMWRLKPGLASCIANIWRSFPHSKYVFILPCNGTAQRSISEWRKRPSFPKTIWFGRKHAVVVEQAKASSLP